MQPAPEINHLAPVFDTQDAQGQPISSTLLRGQPYVLYFYPKNNTPGCTKEACDLRDIQSDIMQLHAKVIGISPDSWSSHDQFITQYALNFTLISDPHYDLCSLFNTCEEKMVEGKAKWSVIRTTFIVDAKGIICWIEKPVQVEGHAQRILQTLHNLSKATSAL